MPYLLLRLLDLHRQKRAATEAKCDSCWIRLQRRRKHSGWLTGPEASDSLGRQPPSSFFGLLARDVLFQDALPKRFRFTLNRKVSSFVDAFPPGFPVKAVAPLPRRISIPATPHSPQVRP